jgi:two-component system, cell cycle sensor histidine kinase and response regulator CckA
MRRMDTGVVTMETWAEPKRILVVDDEALMLKLLKWRFTSRGYSVEAVESGGEALALLETQHFDLILTDNAMPRMSGLEFARTVKARFPAMPILMFSGHPEAQQPPCIDRTLRKPEDIPVLVSAVEELLSGATSKREQR